jgi:hypothetical protein
MKTASCGDPAVGLEVGEIKKIFGLLTALRTPEHPESSESL